MSAADTATEILSAAQGLIQARGFNAFSYKDLEASVGIRTASIHYHFPTKAELVRVLVDRYREELEIAISRLEAKSSARWPRLRGFIQLYRRTEEHCAICLCGSLASDHDTLPPEVQDSVQAYLDRSESWVTQQISAGVREGEFAPRGRVPDIAAALIAGLQGGLILARARGQQGVLERVERALRASLLPS